MFLFWNIVGMSFVMIVMISSQYFKFAVSIVFFPSALTCTWKKNALTINYRYLLKISLYLGTILK